MISPPYWIDLLLHCNGCSILLQPCRMQRENSKREGERGGRFDSRKTNKIVKHFHLFRFLARLLFFSEMAEQNVSHTYPTARGADNNS